MNWLLDRLETMSIVPPWLAPLRVSHSLPQDLHHLWLELSHFTRKQLLDNPPVRESGDLQTSFKIYEDHPVKALKRDPDRHPQLTIVMIPTRRRIIIQATDRHSYHLHHLHEPSHLQTRFWNNLLL